MKSLFFASFLFLLAEYSFAEELINYTITSDSQTITLEGNLEAKGNVVIKRSNGRNTKAIKQAFNTLLSDEYQEKASSPGFIPLKGNILLKSRAAVKKIGS